MEWIRHINQAIHYLEDNLDGEISYEEAAKHACCSSYYFQRMFSYIAGVSLAEYIRRRRMTQAGFELQSSDKKIIEIAGKYGYDSSSSFNRAFQNVHGINPSAARLEGAVLHAYPKINFSVQVTGGESMGYRIEKKEAMRVVGIRCNLAENMEENQKVVPEFWEQTKKSPLFSEIGRQSNGRPDGILGITAYSNADEIYYYIAAASDQPAPEGMVEYEIPASTWVVFEGDGCFKESVQMIFKRFLTEWLPFSGFEYAMLPDIEVYPMEHSKTGNRYPEVWIAVNQKKEY